MFSETKDFLTDENTEQQVEAEWDDLNVVLSYRRGIQFVVPKCKMWFEDVLGQLDDNRFRQMLRCTRQQFDYLHSLICKSPVYIHLYVKNSI